MPSGASDEPVIGSFISSRFKIPTVVIEPANKMIIHQALIGDLPIDDQPFGLVLLL